MTAGSGDPASRSGWGEPATGLGVGVGWGGSAAWPGRLVGTSVDGDSTADGAEAEPAGDAAPDAEPPGACVVAGERPGCAVGGRDADLLGVGLTDAAGTTAAPHSPAG